jgi:hypothetical protein
MVLGLISSYTSLLPKMGSQPMSAEAGQRTVQPADEVTEKYWQLVRQNRAFIAALHAAVRSGSETAAGVTFLLPRPSTEPVPSGGTVDLTAAASSPSFRAEKKLNDGPSRVRAFRDLGQVARNFIFPTSR